MEPTEAQTKLAQHKLKGKKLIPPLAQLNINNSSWIDDRLPDMLWAVLLVNHFSRDIALKKFAEIVNTGVELTDTSSKDWRKNPLIVTLTGIAKQSEEVQLKLINVIANDEENKKALVPLLLFKNLPARKSWEKIIKLKPDNASWNDLANALVKCFFHQTQEATDCRWVKALYVVKSNFIIFTSRSTEVPENILNYPSKNSEELRLARPIVRSLEIGLDMNNATSSWSQDFWKNCLELTGCITKKISKEDLFKDLPTEEQMKIEKEKLHKINQDLTDHFWNTLNSSDHDPKHEVTFGIGLYAIDLALGTILLQQGKSTFGRLALRTLVECLINLKYMSINKDSEIWQTFVNHGMGQAKLVLQRSEEDNVTLPYLNNKNLHQISNEDKWMEFISIDLGNWENSNLRSMAIEVGLKNEYDYYYTWPSSYSHGHWGAIRESVLDFCGNVLHRFHRIPLLYGLNLEDCHDDIYSLLNEIISLIYSIYPKKENKQ